MVSGPGPVMCMNLFRVVSTWSYGLVSVLHVTPLPAVRGWDRTVEETHEEAEAHSCYVTGQQATHISRTMTILALSSKASTHWTSLGW